MKLYELILKGGIFMYPIIACSVLALAIFLERLWATRKKATLPFSLMTEVENFLSRGQLSEAKALLKREKSLFARISYKIIDKVHTKKSVELRQFIENAGKLETSQLYRGVEALGTIANVSTLLGLLGTISGMIKIFSAIYVKQFVNPADLAGGISEALYTTAAGLSVAIPTLLAYRFISGRIEKIILYLEEVSEKIFSLAVENKDNKKESG